MIFVDYEVDHYKTEVCFTVVYAMLDFREIAVYAQLDLTSSYKLLSTAPLSLIRSPLLSASWSVRSTILHD